MHSARINSSFSSLLLLALLAWAPGSSLAVTNSSGTLSQPDGDTKYSIDAVEFLQRRPPRQNLSIRGISSAILFVMSRGHLYRVSADHPSGVRWSEQWDNPQQVLMAPDNNGGVFVLSRHHLYRVTTGNKDGDRWSTGWTDAASMKTDGRNGVFIVNKGTLYHVTSEAKEGIKMPGSWLSSARTYDGMMDIDGKGGVFVARGTELWHAMLMFPLRKIAETKWGAEMYGVTYDGADGVFFTDTRGTRQQLAFVDYQQKRSDWSDGWHVSLSATDGNRGIFLLLDSGELTHVSPSHKGGYTWSDGWHPPSDLDVTHRGGMVSDGQGGVFLLSHDSLFHIHPKKTKGDFWSNNWATNSVFVLA